MILEGFLEYRSFVRCSTARNTAVPLLYSTWLSRFNRFGFGFMLLREVRRYELRDTWYELLRAIRGVSTQMRAMSTPVRV